MGFAQSIVQALTEVSTTAKEELGKIYNRGDSIYKYVKYTGGAGAVAGTAGRICYYDATSGWENALVTCDISDADAVPIVAGQLMATLAEGEFGWIRVVGLSDALNVDVVAGTVGQKLTGTGATDGTLDVAALVTDVPYAVLLDATASSQRVYLQCPVFQ